MIHDSRFSGFLEAPPRSSRARAAMVLCVVALLSLAAVTPVKGSNGALVLLIGLLLLAVIYKAVYAIHIALFASLWILLAKLVPVFQIWPFRILAPLVIYGCIAALVPQLRRSIGWLRTGGFKSEVRKLIVFTVVVSFISLIGWVVLTQPDLGRHLRMVPHLSFWVYPFAGIGFAIFNAAMEEAIFRGIVMEALESALGAGYLSVCIQAVPFAAVHYTAGFPNGLTGVVMALFYGVLLGAIRRLSGGMLAPFITHVAADATIFSILVFVYFH